MYFLSDTPAAIREVQKFLYVISDRIHNEVPRVAIDGIYGPGTEVAVRIFQQIYGLEESGKVDRSTFDILYIAYNSAMVDIALSDFILTDAGFPIVLGSQNNDVVLVHLLINELGKTYKDIGFVNTRSSYFSEESQNAVKELQKIFKLTESGEVDKLFFESMKQELEAIKRLNAVYI